ncbi:efflux transporter periplasmic adaptor subunit [Burkholderia pyrrocinia]|uniref:Efflux transporter periplasmic adaptor subunit n=1 Tax=Burkholderia pyrrocinia TaxID=60550 RepID=A0A2Z5N7I3_BURPY|nr:efflux RND transporter periplasmic adaptor subunit [Burkholderia pyrrocinia]AXF25542.1 efflux transporter periplasmic adaptor subunit [Burkholderia pyrrocinia]
MKLSRFSLVAAALAAVVALCVPLFIPRGTHGAAGDPPPSRPVAILEVPVTPVVTRTVPVFLEYVGTTDAIRTVTLQAQVTGYLLKQAVPDGSDVTSNELLYQIDPRTYQATLDAAKAQAEKDAAALEYAAASHRRNAVLSETGDVSTDTLQQSASSEHQGKAAVAADRALIETAQLNLHFTGIRAPFAGRLGLSQVHEGALISTAGTQLNTLVQLDPIYATFNPPDTDLPEIQMRQSKGAIPADVIVGQTRTLQYHGRLTFLDNSIVRGTGTITARATIENPDHTLLPGQFIHVRLHVADQPDTLLVPQVAVGSNQLGQYVYIVGPGNHLEQRYVTLGADYAPFVAVLKGVVNGESVVVGNLLKLGPGAVVRPTPLATPQAAAPTRSRNP